MTLPPGRLRVDGYGDSPALSRELLALIVSGRKRAGTGLLWALEHDGEDLPQVGDIELVIDHRHQPALVTRLTEVDIRAFDQVDARYAAIEGEGDGSLAFWRQAHEAFFGRECARIGRTPSPDMPVVCCVFELLSVVPGAEIGPGP
ncbi:ASCH domain-containing protein [Ideonella sp. 4Y11]|uniref:ASCH domain-containing protein n=1 Tax=Ideonella aquatica TaxID=2824119 RepID=A0A940YGC0_9BURK|nr:ASCH domain-containing protein [Ideonella aquatica]